MTKSILMAATPFEPPHLKRVKQSFVATQDAIEFKTAANREEIETQVGSGWTGLLLLVIAHKEDLLQTVSLMTKIETAVRQDKTVRVLIFSQLNNPKVGELLKKYGAADVVDFKIGAKALTLKIERQLKLIQDTAQTTPPLETPADFWLTPVDPIVRRVMNQWEIELIGPGPSAGEWIKGAESTFEWRARETLGPFSTSRGRWIFSGKQVEFIWRANRWRFSGDPISLVYLEKKQIFQRFYAESASRPLITENSSNALSLHRSIMASFAGELHDFLFSRHLGANPPRPTEVLTPKKDDSEFETAEDAFKSVGLRISVDSWPAEVLEASEDLLVILVERADLKMSNDALFEVMTDNLKISREFAARCRVLKSETEKETGYLRVSLQLDENGKIAWGEIQSALRERQLNILRFLKLARGV